MSEIYKKFIEQGIFPPEIMSNEQYHDHAAVSSSGLSLFGELPDLYHRTYITKTLMRKKTNVIKFGQHAHIWLLEPEKFKEKYVVLDNKKVIKKTVKEWLEFAKQANSENKTPLLYKEYENLQLMAAEIQKNEEVLSLLKGGMNEFSFFVTEPTTGVDIKARTDVVNKRNTNKVIVDYKTTTLALDIRRQSNYAEEGNRYFQAAFHKLVLELKTGDTIEEIYNIVQNCDNALVRIFKVPHAVIEHETEKIYRLLKKFKECQQSGVWPKYLKEVVEYEPTNRYFYLNSGGYEES